MNEHFDRVTPKTLTSEERKERDRQRRADAELAMKEHEAAQRAFYANRERLRAERLAREAKAEDDAELARQSSQHH
jgi:hypothetical protein